jgi:sec-independent protein translocase protein TatA
MFEGIFQPGHLIIVLVIVLLVYGPSKLPKIGAGLGKSIRDFKSAMDESNYDAPAKRLPAPAQVTATAATVAPTEVKSV